MKTVLCFGDSNTWGAMPMRHLDDDGRHGIAERWTGVAAARLGSGWRLIDEGLPGRTTVHDDPLEGADRNGARAIRMLIDSHRPLDALVIMLGTNDLKARFGLPAVDIAQGVAVLGRMALAAVRPGETPPALLLVAPPPIREVGCLAPIFAGGEATSREVAGYLEAEAARLGAGFLDGGSVAAMSPDEGIHMDAAAHRALGLAIAEALIRLVP